MQHMQKLIHNSYNRQLHTERGGEEEETCWKLKK